MLSKLTGASTMVVVVAGLGLGKSGVDEVQAIDQALVELPPSQRRIIGSGAGTPRGCCAGWRRRGPVRNPVFWTSPDLTLPIGRRIAPSYWCAGHFF